MAYSMSAPKTKRIQETIQAEMADNPSTLGEIDDTFIKILISTRKSNTSKDIRPGTTSGGI